MMEIIYIIMNMEILFTVERGRLLVNDYGSTCRNLLIDRKKIELTLVFFFRIPVPPCSIANVTQFTQV